MSGQSAHRWQQSCQPNAPAAIYSPETLFFRFWYSFMSEADQTQGPSAGGGLGKLKTKFIHLIGSPTRDLPSGLNLSIAVSRTECFGLSDFLTAVL
jgi:hypothetical protein